MPKRHEFSAPDSLGRATGCTVCGVTEEAHDRIVLTHKCPYCLADLELSEGEFPYHDHPKPTRRICSGAKKTPTQALDEFKSWIRAAAKEQGLVK